MGYIIKYLKPIERKGKITSEDVDWSTVEYEETVHTRYGEKFISREIQSTDEIPECGYLLQDTNSGGIEDTIFPMYTEISGNRKLDMEKIVYGLYDEYGEGIYRIRFSDGNTFQRIISHLFVTKLE